MQIEDLMCRDVYHCRPEDSLESAARLMWEHDCGCAPVCIGDGEQRLVGMITDRDIAMCALFQGKPLRDIAVQDAMSQSVSACYPGDAPDKVEQVMSERQIRRIPIISNEGRLLGIVSLADLVRETGPRSSRVPGRITESEIRNTLEAICERPGSRRTTSGPSMAATA